MTLKYDDRYVKIHPKYEAILNANHSIQAKIDWGMLSSNRAAIDLLTANQDWVNWYRLSINPATIELLAVNQDKIRWDRFCETSFLGYDYIKITEERGELNQAIIAAVHHPSRIQKWLNNGNDFDNYMM